MMKVNINQILNFLSIYLFLDSFIIHKPFQYHEKFNNFISTSASINKRWLIKLYHFDFFRTLITFSPIFLRVPKTISFLPSDLLPTAPWQHLDGIIQSIFCWCPHRWNYPIHFCSNAPCGAMMERSDGWWNHETENLENHSHIHQAGWSGKSQQTNGEYHQFSNIRRIQSQNINVSRFVLQLSLPNPLKCEVENEDVVEAAPIGDAPTTSEWSTILLPAKVRLILETLQ